MQRLTFDMIGTKKPLQLMNKEDLRSRLNTLGFIDPSIILKTDNTVDIKIEKNVYTVKSNLTIKIEFGMISDSTYTLSKENHGIQEVLVNMEDNEENPGYGETIDYTVSNNTIVFNSQDFNGHSVYIKYLTIN